MSLKDGLDSSLRKDDENRKKKKPPSKAYHRFFEGYSEITVPKPNGKGYTIQRIYTGDYHRQDLTKSQRIWLRVLYVVLFLGAAYLFVSSAILPLVSNATWYVALSQAISIPLLFWVMIVFYSYLPAKQDLTIHEYRSSSLALQKATFGSAVSLGIAALATLIFVLLNLPDGPLTELICAVKYIAGGLLVYSINLIEKGLNYLIIPSQNIPPPDAMEIK